MRGMRRRSLHTPAYPCNIESHLATLRSKASCGATALELGIRQNTRKCDITGNSKKSDSHADTSRRNSRRGKRLRSRHEETTTPWCLGRLPVCKLSLCLLRLGLSVSLLRRAGKGGRVEKVISSCSELMIAHFFALRAEVHERGARIAQSGMATQHPALRSAEQVPHSR